MNYLLQTFYASEIIFIATVFLLSLIIGSFLNVVIARLPKTLNKEWSRQCFEFLKNQKLLKENIHLEEDKNSFVAFFVKPSHCPHCATNIKPYDNVPLLSYVLLHGKCRACQKRIAIQYPLIESLTAILASLVALYFDVSWQTLAGCVLTYVLIVQATIDIHHTIIPDEITIPMIWIGLFISTFGIFCDTNSSIIGAIFGYLSLWSVYWAFYLFTKKEGMGYGDFKLLAMLGAWLGWQMLPFIIIFSSTIGSIIGGIMLLRGKYKRLIPFGPFLAIAGWIALIWGPKINAWYLHYTGL